MSTSVACTVLAASGSGGLGIVSQGVRTIGGVEHGRSIEQSLLLARAIRLDVEVLEQAAVRRARDGRWSYGRIGEVLGISRQAVAQRLMAEPGRRRAGAVAIEAAARARRERLLREELESRAMLPAQFRKAVDEDYPLAPRPDFDLETLSTFVQSTIRANEAARDRGLN